MKDKQYGENLNNIPLNNGLLLVLNLNGQMNNVISPTSVISIHYSGNELDCRTLGSEYRMCLTFKLSKVRWVKNSPILECHPKIGHF